MVAQRTPHDPTGLWHVPTRRDNPLRGKRFVDHGMLNHVGDCGGLASESLATRQPTMPKTRLVNIRRQTSNPTRPFALGDLPTIVRGPSLPHSPVGLPRSFSLCSKCLRHERVRNPQQGWWQSADGVVAPWIGTLKEDLPRTVKIRHGWDALPQQALLCQPPFDLFRRVLN